jgi:hypothetical protein
LPSSSGYKNPQARKQREQVAVHAASSLVDFSTLKMEAIHSSEMSVRTRTTRYHIPENGILNSHRCENLKSYRVKFILPIHRTQTDPSVLNVIKIHEVILKLEHKDGETDIRIPLTCLFY